MTGRRKTPSPISECFSPDQRTGRGERTHRARKLSRLLANMRDLWSHHLVAAHGSFRAKRLPPRP